MLMAVGLAGDGGGRGWTFRTGAVEARLRAGAGGGGGGMGGEWFPGALPPALVVALVEVAGKDGDEDDANDAKDVT